MNRTNQELKRPRILAGSRAQSGFTLIELIVSMMVFSVGILGMASVMAATSRQQNLANNRLEMVTLADSKLEELRSHASLSTADTLQLALGGSIELSLPDHFDSPTGLSGRAYVRRWSVTPGSGTTREVTLRISRASSTGPGLKKLDFSTLILIQ